MKLLLTSGGVTNPSIRAALIDLLGKPVEESSALCIPTAMWGHPLVGPGVRAWRFISGASENPMVDLGWKSVGVLELTALPSIDTDLWVPLVREADALLVAGGDVLYLSHWMRQSGLADLLPSLSETVWVGLSAGSLVMTPLRRRRLHPVATARRRGDHLGCRLTSRSVPIWLLTGSPATPWLKRSTGQQASPTRPTPWTTRRRSRWSAGTSTSSPRATGSSCAPE